MLHRPSSAQLGEAVKQFVENFFSTIGATLCSQTLLIAALRNNNVENRRFPWNQETNNKLLQLGVIASLASFVLAASNTKTDSLEITEYFANVGTHIGGAAGGTLLGLSTEDRLFKAIYYSGGIMFGYAALYFLREIPKHALSTLKLPFN